MMAVVCSALLLAGAGVDAADFTLKTADKPPPQEIGDSMRGTLQAKAIQLMQSDKPVLEIWFRQEVPLKSKPASAKESLGTIRETTFMGVVSIIDTSLHDYKDNEIPKGIYTVRYGLQPKDGDHLGTSEFDYYFVLIAATDDKDLNGLSKFKSMVKASGKSTASGHPLVVSLRPASGGNAMPGLTDPEAEHKAILVNVPAIAGEQKTEIAFEMVYQGHGHIQ